MLSRAQQLTGIRERAALLRAGLVALIDTSYWIGHLLAATILTPGARLWTRDRHLGAWADSLGLRFAVP